MTAPDKTRRPDGTTEREGTFRVRTEQDREGAPWDLVVRIEPAPGCAVDVPQGYRLSVLTYRTGSAADPADTVRVTGDRIWPTWDDAVSAARALVSRLRGDEARANGSD